MTEEGNVTWLRAQDWHSMELSFHSDSAIIGCRDTGKVTKLFKASVFFLVNRKIVVLMHFYMIFFKNQIRSYMPSIQEIPNSIGYCI